jgi:hypothetical protein
MPDREHINPNSDSSLKSIDWFFLFFLIGAVYVKTYVKIGVIILYFGWLAYKKVRFDVKLRGPVLFYISIPLVGLVSALANHSFRAPAYLFGYLFGVIQWVLCAAIFFLMLHTVRSLPARKMIRTVEAFFIVNMAVTVLQLIGVMLWAKSIMPYWVYDADNNFGVSTGDQLRGVYEANSITNSIIAILSGIYFLYNRRLWLALFSFLIVLLCTSNLSLIVVILFLLILVVVDKRKIVKKQALGIVILLALLYPVLSPTNIRYAKTIYEKFTGHHRNTFARFDSSTNEQAAYPAPTVEDSARYTSVVLPGGCKLKVNGGVDVTEELNNLRLKNDSERKSTSNVALMQPLIRESFKRIYGIEVYNSPLAHFSKPGKAYSYLQTIDYLRQGGTSLLFGAGTGNFSSKLALKMTGLGLQGKYPAKRIYAARPFLEYHLYTVFYYLAQGVALHSVINFPNSVYNQLFGEYGIVGALLFLVLYVGYFFKTRNKKGFGIYMLLIALIFFNIDYWFEMATFTVIFELLMLMDIFVYDKASNPADVNGIDARI